MEFHVSLGSRGDHTSRIYRALRDAVLDGRLRPGDRLPATRQLAARLGVSRNTVAAAYERLSAEGFLVGRVGAGTFVAAPPLPGVRTEGTPRGAPPSSLRPRPFWTGVVPDPDPPLSGDGRPVVDLRAGSPDPRLFPLPTWRRLVAAELRHRWVRASGYADPAGHAGLRDAIARHVGVARSVRAAAGDVLVTQGAQQAIDLIGRVLVEPGDVVAVEEPGYRPARLAFAALGARVSGVPVDDEGIVVDALPASARLVYVTPSHQFPLGTAMSLARRSALLDWAARRDAVVVEDDYDSEYRFAGRPLEPLHSLDRSGRVVYVGSFSKTLLPALRVGFLVAPPTLLPALRSAKQLADWHGDLVTQGALARFADEGLLARHVRRATREYAARREALLAALTEHLAGVLEPVDSVAGLHLCTFLAPGVPVDLERVLADVRAAGVAVTSLAAHRAEGPGRPGVVFGYGLAPAGQIDRAVRLLAEHLLARR